MAKKAPISDQAFSPVKSGLVHAVVDRKADDRVLTITQHGSAANLRPANRHLADTDIRQESHPESGAWFDKLTREKRVLLTRNEEVAVNELVHHLSSNGATSLKLSHLLRACVIVLRHCEKTLIENVRGAPPFIRPANGDPIALGEFELRLAQEVAAAIRSSPPLPGRSMEGACRHQASA